MEVNLSLRARSRLLGSLPRRKLTLRYRAILLLLCAAFAVGDSQSQTAARARSINGVVLDPSGAAIVGAQVTLTRGGGAIAETTTDNSGSFRFDHVTEVDYLVDVHHEGFRETKITVNAGEKSRSPVRIVMQLSVATQEVTVQADASAPLVTTDTAQNQSASTINRAALDRLPVFDQDYITTMSRFLNDNATGTNGVTLVVNGVEANGPGVTASAVQEVKINQNPYSARFSRPGRARLEITTKGGTPNYHGSLNFLFRDSVFDARNAFAEIKPSETRQYYEGALTGPIGSSKRTSFLLSLDEDRNNQQAIVEAEGPNGLINQNVPNPTHHFFGAGRVFHDLANGDQFWVGYSYEDRTVKNQSVGGTVLPSAGTNTQFQEHEINVSYRHVFSRQWMNQLRFLVGHYDSPIASLNSDPRVVVQGAFTGGGAQADFRKTEYHFDGTDFLTCARGKHELSFGIDVPDISRRGFDDFTLRAGSYTFGSLHDYAANLASTLVVQQGQGHVVFLEKVLSGFIEDNIRLKPNFSLYLGIRYYWQNYFHDDPNNIAPRFGFAYAPSKDRETVVRGGAGVFYDRSGPSPIADLLHFNGINLLRFIVENPAYPPPTSLLGVPTSVVVLDPHARIPYTVQYSIGIERQVTAKSTFSATYIGSRGIDLFRSIDANAPRPPEYLARPKPNLGQEREIESEGYQKGTALELTFRGKLSKFFSGQVQYTLSKTYNNTGGITYFPANSYDPNSDWARSDNDRAHKFDLLGSAQPTRFFTFGAALSLYSGKPVNVTTGTDSNDDGVINDRPAGVQRNLLHGPGFINLDLKVGHDFTLSKARKEARTLTVSLNSFNVLNHRNDVTYVGVITSPFFGQAVQAQPPRRMQLEIQFKF